MSGRQGVAKSTSLLFVYGTLMKGFGEDWQRKCGAEFAGRGTIRANLYDLGDYPGARVVGAEPGQRVSGELYRLRHPELALKTLDEYEEFSPLKPNKSLFVRELLAVTLEDGRKKELGRICITAGSPTRD